MMLNSGQPNSLVQWLGLHTYTVKGTGSVSGQELKSCKPLVNQSIIK